MIKDSTLRIVIIYNIFSILTQNNTLHTKHLILLVYNVSFIRIKLKILSHYSYTLILIYMYLIYLGIYVYFILFFICLFCCCTSQKMNSVMNTKFVKVCFNDVYNIMNTVIILSTIHNFILPLLVNAVYYLFYYYYSIIMRLVYYLMNLLLLCYVVLTVFYFIDVHCFLLLNLWSLRSVSTITFYFFNNG